MTRTWRFAGLGWRGGRTRLRFLVTLLPFVFLRRFVFFLLLFSLLAFALFVWRPLPSGARFQLRHIDLAQMHRKAGRRGVVFHLGVFAFGIVELDYLRALGFCLFVDHVLVQFTFFIHSCTALSTEQQGHRTAAYQLYGEAALYLPLHAALWVRSPQLPNAQK